MIKPPSIARFEQFYWGSVILGLINAGLTWSDRQEMMATNPMLANMPWFMPVMTAIGLIIAIILWYFIARSASVVAKWIVVVFAALGALGILFSVFTLLRGTAPAIPVIIGIAVNLLYIAAAWMLFKPDAHAWFNDGRGEPEDAPLP